MKKRHDDSLKESSISRNGDGETGGTGVKQHGVRNGGLGVSEASEMTHRFQAWKWSEG